MGVKGLWEILHPAAEAVPLTQLSLDALKENKDGSRALRIGIDASLWVFHAKSVPHSGLNPFIRTLFFKILKLLQYPVLLLFVFDGPHKPAMKRGNKVGGRFGRGDRESQQFKLLLDEMGLEYWDAPGEAEAELAYINQQGLIDAVLTDDVDALVFGATCVLRNPSRTLSGNASNLSSSCPVSESREDYQVYRRQEIENADLRKNKTGNRTGEEDLVALDVDGMIFLALLVGGDYHPAGMPSCGPKIALGLVQAGLGTNLLQAYRQLSLQAFETHLQSFIESLREELATNAHGFLPGKRKVLASKIPADFPSMQVLEYYAKPKVSAPHKAWPGFARRPPGTDGAGRRGGRGDPRAWARACERFFEWGSKEEVGKRFRTLVWRGEIVQAVRERLGVNVGPVPEKQLDAPSSSPLPLTRSRTITSYFATQSRASSQSGSRIRSTMTDWYTNAFPAPRLIAIRSKRVHIVTGHTAEYRVEYDPSEWNRLIQDAMGGTRLNSAELTPEQRQALDMVSGKAGGYSTSEADSASAVSDEDAPMPTKTRQRKEVNLDSSDKVWIPVDLVKLAFPELEEAYEQRLKDKDEASRTPRKRRAKDSQASVPPKFPAKSPRKQTEARKAAATTSSQQSTVTSWFESNKPASSPLSTPRKKHGVPHAPVIEIIDLSDSPESDEPVATRKAPSTGSSVIFVGSSPNTSSKSGRPQSRSLRRHENASGTTTDTSDDDVSMSARTPAWLRRLARPHTDTHRTPRAKTGATEPNVLDTPPARAVQRGKDTPRNADEAEEVEEYELTPTAAPRGVRVACRASTCNVQIIEVEDVPTSSVLLSGPPKLTTVLPVVAPTRPSMTRPGVRPGTQRTRAKPVLAGSSSSLASTSALPPPPARQTTTPDSQLPAERKVTTPRDSGTSMDSLQPVSVAAVAVDKLLSRPFTAPLRKAKPTVYRLVEETEEAEYYMPDYA
ncbi:hypothetical protein QFC19_002836 [Naganishia cerealis]|uniref:Uncharacterized protein n=1 Tax=Naganishia cerealis TaxID=610337 RepID=A0ACC2W804_9TREE|nr:hypothetical protein QFC19_002836 [Naganishia cerealis]